MGVRSIFQPPKWFPNGFNQVAIVAQMEAVCTSTALPHICWPVFFHCLVPSLSLAVSSSEPQVSLLCSYRTNQLPRSWLIIFDPNHWNKHLTVFWFAVPIAHVFNNTVIQGTTGCFLYHHGLPYMVNYTIPIFSIDSLYSKKKKPNNHGWMHYKAHHCEGAGIVW